MANGHRRYIRQKIEPRVSTHWTYEQDTTLWITPLHWILSHSIPWNLDYYTGLHWTLTHTLAGLLLRDIFPSGLPYIGTLMQYLDSYLYMFTCEVQLISL